MKKSWIVLTITLCFVMIMVSSMSIFAQEKKITVGAKNFTEQYILIGSFKIYYYGILI